MVRMYSYKGNIDPKQFEWMRSIRRLLHERPELSFREFNTSSLIQDKLAALGIEYRTGFAQTGVVASMGQGESGYGHVALRADMDALPVQDEKDVEYRSQIPQVMHACGHDGHVAMLLGAASILKRASIKGRISLIFQPAEEYGSGARQIIAEGGLDSNVQAVFAGHIDTHFPTGIITVDDGIICAFADPFTITIVGSGGHAARPHEAKDALVAGASLVMGLQTLISRETDPNSSAVLTVGKFQSGDAHNIIAGKAVIAGTVRSTDRVIRQRILAGLDRMIHSVGLQYDVAVSLDFHDSLPAVINSPFATSVARQAAERIVGHRRVISQGKSSLGGEDFSYYQQLTEGCLVRFGADSKTPNSPAHSGTFDFDENVLKIGAEWLSAVALQWLDAYCKKLKRAG